MTDDLVKRLRITAGAGSLYPPYPQVINEAADRIEELRDALTEIHKCKTLYGAQSIALRALEKASD